MQAKSLIGGLVGGAAALALCAGCESQVGEGYEGEAILTLEGSVELGEGEVADQVPVLAFSTPDFNAFLLVEARVEGEYPARFRMSVFEPPPERPTRCSRVAWKSRRKSGATWSQGA